LLYYAGVIKAGDNIIPMAEFVTSARGNHNKVPEKLPQICDRKIH
jgi:hypothetical protein